MKIVAMPRLVGLPSLAPLVLRATVGVIMAAHGYQKLMGGPANFGDTMLRDIGVPAPIFMGYVVTFVELFGGLLLIAGLATRIAALLIAVNLTVAVLTVKTGIGLIAPMGAPLPGAELDLALIAGALAVLALGPGRLSVDYAARVEREQGEATSHAGLGRPATTRG
jgi:putative oxidoreductase